MGKRKQRKIQEEHKNKRSNALDNQENTQVKVNSQVQTQINGSKHQNSNHSSGGSLKQSEGASNSYSTATLTNKQSLTQAALKPQAPEAPMSNQNQQKLEVNRESEKQKVVVQKDPRSFQDQDQQQENNLKTLLKNQKNLAYQIPDPALTRSIYKNQTNQLQVQIDKQRNDFFVEGDLDSDCEDEDYGDEDFDEDLIRHSFQQNTQAQKVNSQQQNYYYDELEAAQNMNSKGTLNQIATANKTMIKDIQQLSIEAFIQGDEQIQSDMKFCLYCIYNNYDISQYFKQLLRVQRKLKEWSFQLNPNIMFNIFENNIKEFMTGIRDKLVQEMRNLKMIRQKPATRRYSLDDYLLIDKTFSRSYSLHGYNNEILNHCMKYMSDPKYEAIRTDLRHRIWNEMRKNNEVIVSFYQHPDAYQKVFDLMIKFYTRVRDAVIGIEEMWVFFMESVFHQELKGNMIFEQFHKQLFKKDIIGHRYIQSFLKEINEVQLEYENRRAAGKPHQLDQIIENITQILYELYEDLNFTFPDEDEATDAQVPLSQQQPQESIKNPEIVIDEELKDDLDQSDSELIFTYQQLSDRIKQQYGGFTLAQQVEQYSQQNSNYLNILHSIQYDKRCQELMKNLPNLDTDTLCYIIENNLSKKDYEKILFQNKSKAINDLSVTQDLLNAKEDIIISPIKNLDFLNQQVHDSLNDGFYVDKNDSLSANEDEDDDLKAEKQLEKKKKKNLKKKRKRKEKKILAQHQTQMEEILKLKMLQEQKRRLQASNDPLQNELRLKLIERLGISEADLDVYGLSLNDLRKSSVDSYQNEMQTKPTQCDDEDEDDHNSEFEKDLEQFRERLEKTTQSLNTKTKHKLVPNIPEAWIDQLRDRLKHYYQCQSPKHTHSGKAKTHQMGEHSDTLWMKGYQRSA